MITVYEVYFMEDRIGTLETEGPGRSRFTPCEGMKKHENFIMNRLILHDSGWTSIPLFENMIRDTTRMKPDAKYIARFTNEYVLVRIDPEDT